MRASWVFIFLFSITCQAEALLLKAGTYNMQGWVDSSSGRYKKLNDLLKSQQMLKGVSVLMLQESIEHPPLSSAQLLAREMGWDFYSERRTSDQEGLGFLYPPTVKVLDRQALQIKAKHSPRDYSRMALTLQIEDKTLGRVRFINTHLAHQPKMAGTRKRQLREIISWLRKLEKDKPSDILVFGGDLNTGPKESYYADEFSILTKSNFQFVLIRSIGASYTWIDKSSGQNELVDHFFVSQKKSHVDLRSSRAKIYTQTTKQNLSDHNLVVLNLE